MGYYVIKRYGHERGFSCCFRQAAAKHSHCQFLHGYALGFELEFGAERLDERNWVIDFGGLKPVKEMLDRYFDHTLAVAQDDPMADVFVQLESKHRLAQVRLFDHGVGCEQFARFVFEWVHHWLSNEKWNRDERVWLQRVRVSEHNGNHAEYYAPQEDPLA